MSRLARLTSLIASLCVCVGTPAALEARQTAQDPGGEPPAHISVVDGTAVLERDGRIENAPLSMPLLAGDRVRTQNGRVEILFADGSTLHLDTNTLVDFQSDEVVRLLNGRVRVNIAGVNRTVGYRIDAPSAWVQITRPGEYRVAVSAGNEIELAVLRGVAELVNEDGRTVLGAGERAFARVGAAPSTAYVFNSAAWDAFDRWSEERRDARLGVSTQYLPETVQPYAATFETYGYWENVPTYGYVWYPRVRPGWRPYYYGRWVTYRPWGWTWIGSDPWAWPTHHYGRWGFSAGGWFWIPGRTWGPAWVSWAYAPGYVSWCPLGWNNHAVFSFNVNYFGGHRYDPWHAWTVVPHGRLATGYVNVNVVNVTHIDVRTRSAFVVRPSAPDLRGYAVPRSSAPIRTAVSRSGSFGNVAAFQRSPAATTGVPGPDAGPSAAFRSRRSSGAPLSGPGYPAPARAPERVSPSRERGYAVAPPSSSDRTSGVRSRSGGAPSAPATPAPPSEPGPMERRAVPRSSPENAAPGANPQVSTPSRRTAPGYRAVPSDPAASPYDARPDTYRAVPRNERRGDDLYAPSRTYGGQPDRRPYGVPGVETVRPAPRSEPDASPYRSRPGVERAPSSGERSAPRPGMDRPSPGPSGPPPSGPPPSAAPSRPSEGSAPASGGSVGGRTRGSSGGSTGRAVPRGRGGQ
ncbi:MAG TPA: DUF6600 domain-containing protein [Vicinamibacterales bacterium]|nr:DUF6600 domain-containing protein [Vicinamibacterales bacterium]